MKVFFFFNLLISLNFYVFSQFEPAPNFIGTSAIYKDSNIFVSWANKIYLQRGKQNIADNQSDTVTFGLPENALYKAEGNSMDVVSLGDSGFAILSFPNGIGNGPGFDFAIFENAFEDNIMELAFVEVSSNGEYYSRFPCVSNIPLNNQLTGFEQSDCQLINNFAGKYRQGFGTPFDLEEIQDINVDINNITHVKIIDVIGDISGIHSSYDSNGKIVNDPFPTPFPSSGFDLDAIGVINESNISSINKLKSNKSFIFPNPCENHFNIYFDENDLLSIYSIDGIEIKKIKIIPNSINKIFIEDLSEGIYLIKYNDKSNILIKK